MCRIVLVIVGLYFAVPCTVVHAQDEPVDMTQQAEHVRLSNEMARLASRNAWGGVERIYADLVAMDTDLSFEDYVSGAHSARDIGDITAVKKRLVLATRIQEDEEITDWLFEIDGSYGRVNMSADKGKADLTIVAMPFSPEQRKTIEFAMERVAETGSYKGLLPAGEYSFGPHSIEVIPRVQSIRIDLRTQRFRKKQARQDEKEAK